MPLAGRRRDDLTDALWAEALREDIGPDGKPTKNVVILAHTLFDKAKKGDMTAIGIVYERLEGKVPQALTDGSGEPISVSIQLGYKPQDQVEPVDVTPTERIGHLDEEGE